MATKLEREYEALAQKAREGDAGARKDKAKAFEQLRGEQREQARKGNGLMTPSKQALQQAYIQRFDKTKQEKIAKRVMGK